MSWTENKWIKPAWMGGGNEFVTKYQDKFSQIGEKFAPKVKAKSKNNKWGNVIYLLLTPKLKSGSRLSYGTAVEEANRIYKKLGVETRLVFFSGEVFDFDAKSILKNESFAVIGEDKEDVIYGLNQANAEEGFIRTLIQKKKFGTSVPEVGNTKGTKSGIAICENAVADAWAERGKEGFVSDEVFMGFLLVHASIHNTGFEHNEDHKKSGASLYGLEADGGAVMDAIKNGQLAKFTDLLITDEGEVGGKPTKYQQQTINANRRFRLRLINRFGENKANPSTDTSTGETLIPPSNK